MTNNDFEHNRFLYSKDGVMHFGCINPFCGHGSPALPKHYEIPMETKTIYIKNLLHEDRQLTFTIYLKTDAGKHKAKEIVKLICADNLDACISTFGEFFAQGMKQ